MFIKTTTGKNTHVSEHIRKNANLLINYKFNSCHYTKYIMAAFSTHY